MNDISQPNHGSTGTAGPDSIRQTLGLEGQTKDNRPLIKKIIIGSVAVLVVIGIFWFTQGGNGKVSYQTVPVNRGDLTVKVTATGTLEPMNVVELGTEVSGTVKTVLVDFNYIVKKGQLLAKLDPDQLQATVTKSRAVLEVAQAKVKESEATVVENRLKWMRCKNLAERKLCSRQELDTAYASYVRAQAMVSSAKAEVKQAQATLEADETKLSKTNIVSPIDGIVLERKVEPGQTVAASFQTPVLFRLAENLKKMWLHVNIDEADVGQVEKGQMATFGVDAYPGRTFPAKINEVYNAALVVNGVVTYKGVLVVDNSDLSLRPGMTATADITVKTINNALLVPNAALRFTPPANLKSKKRSRGVLSTLIARPNRGKKVNTEQTPSRFAAQEQTVWMVQDKKLVAVKVTTGASDGQNTEIITSKLKPGMRLVVAVKKAQQ